MDYTCKEANSRQICCCYSVVYKVFDQKKTKSIDDVRTKCCEVDWFIVKIVRANATKCTSRKSPNSEGLAPMNFVLNKMQFLTNILATMLVFKALAFATPPYTIHLRKATMDTLVPDITPKDAFHRRLPPDPIRGSNRF